MFSFTLVTALGVVGLANISGPCPGSHPSLPPFGLSTTSVKIGGSTFGVVVCSPDVQTGVFVGLGRVFDSKDPGTMVVEVSARRGTFLDEVTTSTFDISGIDE